MKDFAKSIRTGNSYTKGQVLGEEEGKKYVFGGKINGTYIVHRQPDGKTFSFSSEQEIKDWMRNSKIGNSKAFNKATVLKDGNVWVVLYANETKSKEFNTESEAREFAKQVGNSKVGNADARSQAEEAIRKIEDELKKEKPDIKKYFEIERSINKILNDEYNRLTSQASELRGLQLRIGRMEDKFI